MSHPHTVIRVGNWSFWFEARKAYTDKYDYSFRLLADGGICLYNQSSYTGQPLDLQFVEANEELAIELHNAIFEQTVMHEKEVKEATEREVETRQARLTSQRSATEDT